MDEQPPKRRPRRRGSRGGRRVRRRRAARDGGTTPPAGAVGPPGAAETPDRASPPASSQSETDAQRKRRRRPRSGDAPASETRRRRRRRPRRQDRGERAPEVRDPTPRAAGGDAPETRPRPAAAEPPPPAAPPRAVEPAPESQSPETPPDQAAEPRRVPTAAAAGTAGAAGHQIKRHAQAQFEKWALSYDRSWLNEFIFFPSIRTCQEEIRRWQQRRGATPYRMLDVGCGTGSLLGIMASDPLAELLVGLDYAGEMIRRAGEKFARSQFADKLHALRGDSERLPFGDHTFDVITCCNSFHHYPHQGAAIRGFARVLRPGGLLVLIDGFRDNVIGWVIFDVAVATVEKHVHHAPWSEVRAMIEAAGFEQVRQRKVNVLAPLLVSTAIAASDSPEVRIERAGYEKAN